GVVVALSRKDPDTAARLLDAAISRNLLPLGTEFALSESLAAALLADRSIPTARLLEIARKFRWYGARNALLTRQSFAEHQLVARIDAELWLAELRRRAGDITFYLGGHTAAAARLLLGKGRFFFAKLAPPEPPLALLTGQLSLHYLWIGSQFDETR